LPGPQVSICMLFGANVDVYSKCQAVWRAQKLAESMTMFVCLLIHPLYFPQHLVTQHQGTNSNTLAIWNACLEGSLNQLTEFSPIDAHIQ